MLPEGAIHIPCGSLSFQVEENIMIWEPDIVTVKGVAKLASKLDRFRRSSCMSCFPQTNNLVPSYFPDRLRV